MLQKRGFIIGSFLTIKFFLVLGQWILFIIPVKEFVIQCIEVRYIKASMHVTAGVHVAAMK